MINRKEWRRLLIGLIFAASVLRTGVAPSAEPPYASHPPMRPLPQPLDRPMADGPAHFVDSQRGDDANAGTAAKPWKTLAHAVKHIEPGETLYLRGGTYYERVTLSVRGMPSRPVTIRSCPGELAILDGGEREFFASPETAWQPYSNGAAGEYVSTKTYPEFGRESRRGVHVLGNFGDSMVPLHGYHSVKDLRSDNVYWVPGKPDDFYSGPGLWWNPDTARVHIRLAHVPLPELGEKRYTGVTDPRKIPLVVAGSSKPTITIENAAHLKLRGLVVRGAKKATISINNAENIVLDRVTLYGGSPVMQVRGTTGLRLAHSALRGLAAPWSSRASMKYFGASSYLLTADRDEPLNREWNVAYCELTDGHDGLYIGTVDGLSLHHSLVDNFNDDGIYVTAVKSTAGKLRIFQNRVSRCLSTISFHGNYPPFETGEGVSIYRNVFDLRPVVHYQWYTGPGDEIVTRGRLWGEHGGPVWEPVDFYQNTVLGWDNRYGAWYAAGWGSHLTSRTPRRVFNNLFVQIAENPGLSLRGASPAAGGTVDRADFQVDGNLHWSVREGPGTGADFFAAFRKSSFFERSQAQYPPGWTANDIFADPRFVDLDSDYRRVSDLRLAEGSPAIDAGVPLPERWPDPLQDEDNGRPDIGALPRGVPPNGLGMSGRLNLFGAAR